MRVLVCGGRNFNNYDLMRSILLEHFEGLGHTLIQGCATGADTMAKYIIQQFNQGGAGITIEDYPANWAYYGKRAGYIRNRSMLDEGRPDLVIAFWDGKSFGTKMMINLAQAEDIKTIVVDY